MYQIKIVLLSPIETKIQIKVKLMLLVENLSIRFGEENVIEHFSCHIKKGEWACVVGKSGCGKTSLLKAFIGLTPTVGGTIMVDGVKMNEFTCESVRKKTVYLPQDLAFPNETVRELVNHTIRMGEGVKNVQSSTDLLHENMALLDVGVDLLEKSVSEVSGGQRQRIILAALSVRNKKIWLLDEPTAALDAESRNRVMEFLQVQQRKGTTIVAVSHDSNFISGCSNVISLE